MSPWSRPHHHPRRPRCHCLMKMFRFRRFEICYDDVHINENLAISTRPKCNASLSYRVKNDFLFSDDSPGQPWDSAERLRWRWRRRRRFSRWRWRVVWSKVRFLRIVADHPCHTFLFLIFESAFPEGGVEGRSVGSADQIILRFRLRIRCGEAPVPVETDLEVRWKGSLEGNILFVVIQALSLLGPVTRRKFMRM